jgi:hypothetical protein
MSSFDKPELDGFKLQKNIYILIFAYVQSPKSVNDWCCLRRC